MNCGRYQVVRELGRGSMGVVYLAHDPLIDRPVALKVLRDNWITGEDFVKRFLKEAKIIGRLSHPNIVTVYDVGEDSGRVYIAMEYLEGMPLNEIIERKEFTPEKVLQLGIQVAEAFNYAHPKGIVHRDIKPSNLIVQPDWTVKITDFGIARIEDSSATVLTLPGALVGTPAYMSPEQVLGLAVDGRCDLFSLGIILYEMSTGERPFGRRSKTLSTLFEEIVKIEPPEPSSANPDVAPMLSRIIMKCLHKTPDKRFLSGKALADALRDCQQEIQIATTAVTRPDEKNWKKRASLLLVPLIFLAVVAGKFFIPQAKALLKVESTPPGAEVYVNGVSEGQTPTRFELPLGDYLVRMSLPGYDDWEGGVQLEKAKEYPLRVALNVNRRPDVQSPPIIDPAPPVAVPGEPEVSVSNRPAAATVLEVESRERQDSGSDASGPTPYETGLTVLEPGRESPAPVAPVNITNCGVLVVESTPSGAQWFLNSQPMGTTPWKEEGLASGTYTVSCKLNGYRDWSKELKIAPGETIAVLAVLKTASDTAASRQPKRAGRQGVDQQQLQPAPSPVPLRPEVQRGTPASERCGEIILKLSRRLQLNPDEKAFLGSHCK